MAKFSDIQKNLIGSLKELNLDKSTQIDGDLLLCETPKIEFVDDNVSSVKEGNYVEVRILNFNENVTYISDNTLISKLEHKEDNIFKIYFGFVTEDTDTTITLRSFKLGSIDSKFSNKLDITVKNKEEEEDDAIINDAFADNKDSSTDVDVTNDKIVFTEDNGEYKEVITEQGDDEKDWSSYQTIARIELEKMDIIKDDTDKDTLAVSNEKIKDVSKCYITNDDYPDGVEIDVGDVDEEEEDSTGILDVFDDDSCIACYTFDNNDLSDLSGNYDLVKYSDDDEDPSYEDAVFGRGIVKHRTRLTWDDLTDKLKDNNKEWSWSGWCYFDSNDTPDNAWRPFDTYRNTKGYVNIEPDFTDFNVDGQSFGDMSDTLETDKWFHIVLIYSDWVSNSHDVTLYIDNNKIGTVSCSGVDSNSDHSGMLGYHDSNSNYLTSKGDQIRVFNKALSDDEVDTLYDEKYQEYKADISSNNLDNTPTSAYFIEENITIKTALTEDDPTNDDFVTEDLDTWKIDDDNKYRENTYKKVSDYTGTKFQRKITGDKNANITYLKSNMWKDQ
jgi:hypothetical protein